VYDFWGLSQRSCTFVKGQFARFIFGLYVDVLKSENNFQSLHRTTFDFLSDYTCGLLC
jgi:hypothetical protein